LFNSIACLEIKQANQAYFCMLKYRLKTTLWG